jgi:gamma-glutamyl-gamma-aminobutyrate hydrolase PuuD
LKIGLSQRILFYNGRAYDSIEHGWYSYLKEHTLYFIPNNLNQDFESIATDLDMLIITGGDDSPLRRNTEVKLAVQMMQRFKPVIGICHGAFMLADLLGSVIENITGHHGTEHAVRYHTEDRMVNSYHSLAIKRLHKSATSLAVDSEGNCEAWIDQKLAGIVWHPERMTSPWIPNEIENLFK